MAMTTLNKTSGCENRILMGRDSYLRHPGARGEDSSGEHTCSTGAKMSRIGPEKTGGN
jgi:hypothetical protein